jgi:DnaK suppressor protein
LVQADREEDAMNSKTKSNQMAGERYAELQRILEERRREILNEVQLKIRDVRAFGASGEGQGVLDAAETSEADIQDDIELALIQMKSETLHKIEEALHRLDERTYGYCFECGDEISEKRLRALPFAVRCKDCEEMREQAEQRERQTQRRSAGFLMDLN